MIKLTKFRRSGLWLLSFIAALLALSPSAGATYYLRGNFPETGNTTCTDHWNSGIDMGYSNSYTLGVVNTDTKASFKITQNPSDWEGNVYGAYGTGTNKDEDYTFPANGGDYTPLNSTSSKNFVIDMKPGFTYVISYSNNQVKVSVAKWSIIGEYNGWSVTDNLANFSGFPLKATIPNFSANGFKILLDNGSSTKVYYGEGGTLQNGAEFTSNLSKTGTSTNIQLNSDAIGKKVEFTLTLSNNVPSKLVAKWDEKPGIFGQWPGYKNWNSTSAIDYDGWTKGEGDWYNYTITPTESTNIYFKIAYSGKYYASDGSSDQRMANGTPIVGTQVNGMDGNAAFLIDKSDVVANKVYTIGFNTNTHQVKVSWATKPSTLFFRYDNFSGGFSHDPIPMAKSADGNVFTYKFTYTANKEVNFNFRQRQGSWSGYRLYPSSNGTVINVNADAVNVGGYDQSNSDPQKTWKFSSTSSDPITVTVDFSGTTPTVQLTQAPAVEGVKEYYLHAGFLNNWDSHSRMLFTPSADDDKVLELKAVYKESNTGNFGFKITDKKPADNGSWYSIGGELAKGTAGTLTDAKPNTTLPESALGKEVLFTLTLGDDYKPQTLTCTWEGDAAIVVGNQMPVYPIGVSSTSAFKRYDKWPVLYLQSMVLNNNRITPEYQMTKINDNRYELEFTMRNTKTQTDSWGEKEDGIRVEGFNNTNSDKIEFASLEKFAFGSEKKHSREGARYKAICTKSESGVWTLTLEPVGDINHVPFLSMLGADWVQSTPAATPTVPRKNNSSNAHKNTDSGWQEAWIQYDDRGKVYKDRSGNVMYNTMWPPRNPINFKTNFNNRDFTISSDQITFKVQETKKGSEWKKEYNLDKDYKFKDYTGASLTTEYGNIVTNPGDIQNSANKNDIEGKLALDDNTDYTLYRVKGMWVNGDVKLWTGWYGVWSYDGGDGAELANWNSHSNWGQYKALVQKGITIHPESTVPMTDSNGDMHFDEPTYFKYVDFFYDNSDPNGRGKSVLFTEKSKGGAQIAAMSSKDPDDSKHVGEDRTNYEVGNYQAALAYLQNLNSDDDKINSVVISSYVSTGTDENGQMVEKVFEWTDGGVKTRDFHTLFNGKTANVGLNSGITTGYVNTADKCASTAKYVVDTTDYPNGNYFYRMTVVLTDRNGKQHTEVVESNPFTIAKQEKITVDVFQLVKVDEGDENGSHWGHYYTFRGSEENPSVPTLPAYELWIENDDKFEGEANFEYDDNGNMISGYVDDSNYKFTKPVSLDKLPEYGLSLEGVDKDANVQKMHFTDKVLVLGNVPNVDNIVGYAYSAQNASAGSGVRKKADGESGGITEEYDKSCMRADQSDRFMHVTNVANWNKRQFDLKMKYIVEVADGEGGYTTTEFKPEDQATYTMVIPEPILKAAKVQVFYGDTDSAFSDDDIQSFTFRDLSFKGRYHSMRDRIEIEYPNTSAFMKERIKKKNEDPKTRIFTINLAQTAEGGPQSWVLNYDETLQDKDDPFTDAVAVGPVLHPRQFRTETPRTVTLTKGSGYSFFQRWEDQDITNIDITDKKPEEFIDFKVKDSKLFYDANGKYGKANDLISQFTITLSHTDGYDPANSMDDSSAATAASDPHNYVFHTDKDDLYEHLHHHSANDYYYVTIVNKDKVPASMKDENGKIKENADTKDYIITDKYEVKEDNVNDKSTVYVPSNKENNTPATEGYVVGDDGKLTVCDPNKVSFLVPAKALLNGNSIDVVISKNYGHWYDEQVDDVLANPYYNQLQVEISYLYPFANKGVSEKPKMNRVMADYDSSDVLKSQAYTAAPDGKEVVTSVEGIEAVNAGSVVAGAGFIEAHGNGVEIYGADGVKIATGEGRYEVAAGVYVVRLNGRVEKVIVR